MSNKRGRRGNIIELTETVAKHQQQKQQQIDIDIKQTPGTLLDLYWTDTGRNLTNLTTDQREEMTQNQLDYKVCQESQFNTMSEGFISAANHLFWTAMVGCPNNDTAWRKK